MTKYKDRHRMRKWMREAELERIADKAHGPRVFQFKDSPSAKVEAKIQELLAKKGKPKYDKQLGYQAPSLTMKEAMSFMPASKRDILNSYHSLKSVLINKPKLEEAIQADEQRIQRKIKEATEEIANREAELTLHRTLEDLKRKGWLWTSHEDYEKTTRTIIQHRKDDITSYSKVLEIYARDRTAKLDYILDTGGNIRIGNRETTLEQARKEGYIMTYPGQADKPFLEKYVTVQKPTKSGGVGTFVSAYHIKDSKTGEEVRLWEWGIDYDVG